MSGGKLPEGWVDTQLGNIIELKYGKSLAAQTRDGFGFPVYGSNGVVGKHSIPLINKSGLIVGRKGSYGVVNKSVGPFFPIDTTYYIDDFYNQPLEFLYYYLSFLPLTKLNRSTAIPGLNRDDAYDLNIALPPLAEQKIIAEKLDTLLAQVDSTKARLEQIPQILKRFRQAVLGTAVNGNLTKYWRDFNNIQNWTNTNWEDILKNKKDSFKRGPFGSALKKSMFVSEGYKVYEQYCPINDDCSYARYFITEDKFNEMKSFEVLDGDFLISCSGVSLGRITQVPKNSAKGIINQALLRVRINNEVYLDSFFKLLFRSPMFQKKLFDNSTGSAIPNLKGVKELKAMEIPLLSLEEQHEIVRRVEQLFAYADTIEKQVNSALTRVKSLTQSILAKAFRGELTAQWRAENPDLISGENSAAALLEKIKAERAASSGKKTSRKKA